MQQYTFFYIITINCSADSSALRHMQCTVIVRASTVEEKTQQQQQHYLHFNKLELNIKSCQIF